MCKTTLETDPFENSVVVLKIWFRRVTSVVGNIYYIARITLIALIASSSVFVFKMPTVTSRIEFISIMLIVTNIVDLSTLEISWHELTYSVLVFAYVLISAFLIIPVLRIWTVPYDAILSCSFIKAISAICNCYRSSKKDKVSTIRSPESVERHKKRYTLKTRTSMNLPIVRQSRTSRHEMEDGNEDSVRTSILETSLGEIQETDQSENENAKDEKYDSRSFKLFIAFCIFVFSAAMLFSVGSSLNFTACELESIE